MIKNIPSNRYGRTGFWKLNPHYKNVTGSEVFE